MASYQSFSRVTLTNRDGQSCIVVLPCRWKGGQAHYTWTCQHKDKMKTIVTNHLVKHNVHHVTVTDIESYPAPAVTDSTDLNIDDQEYEAWLKKHDASLYDFADDLM